MAKHILKIHSHQFGVKGEYPVVTLSIQGLTLWGDTNFGGDFAAGDMIFFCGGNLVQRYQLLQMLMGNMPVPSGAVVYGEQDLHELSQKEREQLQQSEIGFVAGNDLLLDYLTIVENCLISERHIDGIMIEKTKIMLRHMGFSQPETLYPQDLTLQKRRLVAIARCLRKSPKLVFAFELFSKLQSDAAKQLWNDIKKVLSGKDIILIATLDDSIPEITREAVTFYL